MRFPTNDIPALTEADLVKLRIATLRDALDRERNPKERLRLCKQIELLGAEYTEILRDKYRK